MAEVVARRCSTKHSYKKFCKIHRETPVLESLSDNAAGLQAVRHATLLRRDFSTGVSEPAVYGCFTK